MSRDLTSDDWIEEIMAPRRQELELLGRHLSYIQSAAREEGRRAKKTGRQPERAGASVAAEPLLFATCTPNSTPQAGVAEHGHQINVLDQDMKILATIDLPDWGTFRPASAGHLLIEQGFMIRPDARGPDKVNGWTETDGGWMVPVVRTGGD